MKLTAKKKLFSWDTSMHAHVYIPVHLYVF